MIRAWFIRGAFVALLPTLGLPAPAQQSGSTQVVGGRGGSAFADAQPSAGARIVEVRIRTTNRVESVQFIYGLSDGRTAEGPRHGGGGRGSREQVFRLDTDEYVVGLSGRYGDTIDSLSIQTNKRVSQTFGGSGGDRDYSVSVPAGHKAVGFAGRAGTSLDAIGLTHASVYDQPIRSGSYPSPVRGAQLQAGQTLIAGGRGGDAFTDGLPAEGARISEIRVWAGDTIDSIQAVYLLADGRTAEGPRHGGSGGRNVRFQLERDEYVIGLSGRHGDTIDSLTIQTNRRTSQRFGGRGGDRDFRIEVPANQQAIGFTGRSGDLVDAIGLVYAPVSGTRYSPRRTRRPY